VVSSVFVRYVCLYCANLYVSIHGETRRVSINWNVEFSSYLWIILFYVDISVLLYVVVFCVDMTLK